MPSAEVAMLVDMGFSLPRVEKALRVTGNKGVDQAMEWLLAHPDDGGLESMVSEESTENLPATSDSMSVNNATSPAGENAEAKSLKCDVCGKLFKTSLEVEFHATKSGHDSFSESLEEKKPLTDEEKREKLKLLEEKMRLKRKEREEAERMEAYEKEKLRIKSGKEIAEARQRLEDLRVKKILQQRKREKEQDKMARMKIREQIEADKAARRAKAAAESGQILPVVSPPIQAPAVAVPKRDYNEARLQIRLTNGQTLTQSFGSKEQLSAVRLYIEMNRVDPPGLFNLMTTFPRKVFTEDDYDTPLDVLGLVPSAVVIVQRKSE